LKITAREKKYLAICAVVVAAVLFFYAFSWLLENRADVSTKVEQKKKLLSRQRETLDLEADCQKRLDRLRLQLQNDKRRLLPGNSPNVAGSDLGKILEDFANGSGVEITLKTPMPEKKIDDRLMRVSVQIQTNCAIEQLVQFLTAIENYDKSLVVNEFTIYSTYRSSILSSGGALQKRLSPTLIISGFINAPESKPKPPTGT
jgi:hypothetical protein